MRAREGAQHPYRPPLLYGMSRVTERERERERESNDHERAQHMRWMDNNARSNDAEVDSSDRHHFLHESRARPPQIFHQYSPLTQVASVEKKLGIGIARGEGEGEERVSG